MFLIRYNSRVESRRNKKKNPKRITKTKPFTNKYNSEEINFPPEKR